MSVEARYMLSLFGYFNAENVPKMGRLSLDLLFFKRLRTLIGILFPWDKKSITLWLALGVLVCSVIDQITTYLVGILSSEFYVALGNKDLSGFRLLAAKACIIILARAATVALVKYVGSILAVRCRNILNFSLHRLYFKRRAYYKLHLVGEAIDNPDQRMTQDIDKTTQILCCDLLGPVALAPFIILFYTYLTFASSGWIGPAAIYLYFIVTTIVNKYFISPIVNLVSEQEKREGDFRARHMEVRNNVEAIAFYQAGLLENVMTNRKLLWLLKNQKKLADWRFALCFVTSLIEYFGGILSYLIIGIPIFATHIYDDLSAAELNGVVSKNAFYYLYLIYSFTNLINLSDKLASLAGVTHRVVELYEELGRLHTDCLETDRPPSTVPSSIVVIATNDERKGNSTHVNRTIEELHGKQGSMERDQDDTEEAAFLLGGNKTDDEETEWQDDGVAITVDSATLTPPADPNRVLVSGLSLQILQGQDVMIVGPSGQGKTSLLRMFAGLWSPLSGKIDFHWKMRPHNMMFLPQKPYFPSGDITLRQQILYPYKAMPIEKDVDVLFDILKELNLEHLFHKCHGFDTNVDWDWKTVLSLGELRRLSFARVLYFKPRIVFLDEATSNVDFEMEKHMFDLLHKYHITFVAVYHGEIRGASERFQADMQLRPCENVPHNWYLYDARSSARVDGPTHWLPQP